MTSRQTVPIPTEAENRLRRVAARIKEVEDAKKAVADSRPSGVERPSFFGKAAGQLLEQNPVYQVGRGIFRGGSAALGAFERNVSAPLRYFSPTFVTEPVDEQPATRRVRPFTPALSEERVFGYRQKEPVGRLPTFREAQEVGGGENGLRATVGSLAGPESLIPGIGFTPLPKAGARVASQAAREAAPAVRRLATEQAGVIRGQAARDVLEVDGQIKQLGEAIKAARKANAPTGEIEATLQTMRQTRRDMFESILPSDEFTRLGQLEREIDEARAVLKATEEASEGVPPRFGTPERSEYDNARRLARESGRVVTSKAKRVHQARTRLRTLEDEYRQITTLEPETAPVAMAPRTSVQTGLFGDRPAQGQMLTEFSGTGQQTPKLADEEALLAREANRPLPGQRAMFEPPAVARAPQGARLSPRGQAVPEKALSDMGPTSQAPSPLGPIARPGEFPEPSSRPVPAASPARAVTTSQPPPQGPPPPGAGGGPPASPRAAIPPARVRPYPTEPEAPLRQPTVVERGALARELKPRQFQAGERADVADVRFPPKPPQKPPAPPTTGGPDLPSGRRPGGPQNAKPLGAEPDPLQQITDALTPTKEPLRDKIGEAFSQAKWIDSNHILQPLEEATGVPTHKLAQIVNGAYGKGEEVVRVQALPILKRLPRQDVPNLERYMALKRGEDITARNPAARLPGGIIGARGVSIGLRNLKQQVGADRFKAIEQAADDLWQVNRDEVLDYYVRNGILSSQQRTAITSAHPHYIPYAREDFHDALGKTLGGDRSVASVSSSGIPQMDLGGSERKLDKALARLLAGPIKARMVVAKNEAAKGIIRALEAQQKATNEALVFPVDDTGKIAREANIGGATKPNIPREAEHSGLWDTISYFENGEKKTYQIPTEYAAVAKGLDKETTGVLNTVVTWLNKPIRMGAVAYNTAFLPRNVIRDMQSLWQIEGRFPLRDYLGGWKAAITRNSDFSDTAKAGAFMSGIVENMSGRTAVQIAERLGGVTARKPSDALLFLPRLIESANMAAERAPRIATFRYLKAQGLGNLEAGIRARNVTVDFSKSGTAMKVVNQVVPFSNAALQGSVNMLGAIKRHPGRSLALAAAPFATATILTRANNMRFETANQIPDYEHARYWVVVTAEGTRKDGTRFPLYAKIPKGVFAGMVTMPMEALFQYAQANNDRSAVELILDGIRAQAENASPIQAPSGFIPNPLAMTIEIPANKDIFTGKPIVPRREEALLPEQQFGEETSTLAVALGRQFGISPRKIDYALKNVAAGVGEQATWLSGMALEALGYDRPEVYGAAVQPERQRTRTEEVAGSPLVKPFVGTRSSQDERQGWEAYEEAVTASNREFNALPDMNRLGIRLGSVGDSIDLNPGNEGGSVDLTPQQRAAYQQLIAETVTPLIRDLLADPEIQDLSDADKKRVLERSMRRAKETARKQMAESVRKRLEREARRATPTPVPAGAR